ncbi:MAG: hypothetical protein B7Z59_06200 [Acidiphilium sp. 37-67-22]|nr:MAG: hypothetical protein B7Z59_06200 [Acidiphilium sp. 37-67-22]
MRRGVFLCLLSAAALAGCAARPGVTTGASVASGEKISLVGATPGDLRANLGKPSLLRIDGPAQVWLYHSRICRLDLVLYRSTVGRPVVRLARTMPAGVPDTTCVASLEQQRAS